MKFHGRWIGWIVGLLGLAALLHWWRLRRIEFSQDKPILAAARRYGVDPALIKAVVWRESYFDALARGRKGEVGLMQIMEGTANEWAAAEKLNVFYHRQLFDPSRNTQAGAWYLKKVLGRYQQTDNPMVYALADYNAGRANVLRWARGAAATNSARFMEQITFPATRQYVKAVTHRYVKYRKQFSPRSG